MSLRVQYHVNCDRCQAEVLAQDFSGLQSKEAVPCPPAFMERLGMHLCETCEARVRRAVAKAWDDNSESLALLGTKGYIDITVSGDFEPNMNVTDDGRPVHARQVADLMRQIADMAEAVEARRQKTQS